MATEAEIIHRVRLELGDLAEPFREHYRGTGTQDEFDLPAQRISTTNLSAFTVGSGGTPADLVLGTDFTLDEENGVVRLTDALAMDVLLIVEGVAYGLFTDEELEHFVHDATLQHTNGREVRTRYKDDRGFIKYDETPMALDNLPEVENLLVAILATIEALWALSTDMSTDIDITTSEGTHVPRSQRYQQTRYQIEMLTEKYEKLCAQLNVGLGRIEVSTLRRISRTTGRLVPIFKPREYDDTTLPTRVLPTIDGRDGDPDGPPSPATYRGLYG